MKKILALTLVALTTACGHIHAGVIGSGSRQKQKRDVGSFTAITTAGAFDIEVVAQKTPSLELEGDDNVLPLVTTEVSNNVLHINNTRNYSVTEPVRVRISVDNLEGLTVSGAGKIDVSNLKNEKFELDVNGAPVIRVSGETNRADIDSSGAAKIDAHKLRAEKVIVDSKGVSKVEVHPVQQLDVKISGPSHVVYEGDPVVNKTIYGPGSVEKKVSEGS